MCIANQHFVWTVLIFCLLECPLITARDVISLILFTMTCIYVHVYVMYVSHNVYILVLCVNIHYLYILVSNVFCYHSNIREC